MMTRTPSLTLTPFREDDRGAPRRCAAGPPTVPSAELPAGFFARPRAREELPADAFEQLPCPHQPGSAPDLPAGRWRVRNRIRDGQLVFVYLHGDVSAAVFHGVGDRFRAHTGEDAGLQGTERGEPLLERWRSEEHTSELQSRGHLVCRLLLAKKQ